MKKITFKQYTTYKQEEILDLYSKVGWINYTEKPDMVKAAYDQSLYLLGAYDDKDLVGIIRVVGDGHSIIYIQDIVVSPDYQRQGIGKNLLERVLDKYKHVYQKILLTMNEEKTVKFYESVGFEADYNLGLVAFGMFS